MAYNGVLEPPLPPGCRIIGYADDLAVVVTVRKETLLQTRMNACLSKVSAWLKESGLELAPEKSEAILLNGKKKLKKEVKIQLDGHEIALKKEVKYLGVVLDKGLTGTAHVEYVARKAEKATRALTRLMPRTRGAGGVRRRLLATVAESIILYAAPVWQTPALKSAQNRGKLDSVQRLLALRICRAYRTVATDTAMVLADTIPWELKAREREERYRGGPDGASTSEARERTMGRWQERWRNVKTGAWTKRLIPDVTQWYMRPAGREVSFHLCQVLSGHGCFQTYLTRFGKALSGTCIMCQMGEDDDPEHTLTRCARFHAERAEVEMLLGETLTIEGMIPRMIEEDAKAWNAVTSFVERVMQIKEEDERRRQAVA
jgi:hypothetical protein